MCHGQKSRFFGHGRHPTFNRDPYNGYINPYYWVDEFIPYYMEIMGVDRPWHIFSSPLPPRKTFGAEKIYSKIEVTDCCMSHKSQHVSS